MKRIGLIACSSRKLKEAKTNPGKTFLASELYQGKSFVKAVDDGLAEFGCEGYFILSDKFGLVSPDDMIPFYDEKRYKGREWAEKVYSALVEKLGKLDDIEFIFFAGKNYWKPLSNMINFKAVKYNQYKITFDLYNDD